VNNKLYFAVLLLIITALSYGEKPEPIEIVNSQIESASNEKKALYANELCRSVFYYDYSCKAGIKMLEYAKMALRFSQKYGQTDQEILATSNIALSYITLEQEEKAKYYLEKVLVRQDGMQDKGVRMHTLESLIEVLMSMDNYDDQLLSLIQTRRALAAEILDPFEEAHAILHLGIKKQRDGDFENAAKCFEQASMILKQINEFSWGSMALSYLGKSYLKQGKDDLAEETLLEAVSYAKRGDSFFYIERSCVMLGRFYAEKKKFDLAEKHMTESLRIMTKSSHEERNRALFFQYLSLGHLYQEVQKYAEALIQVNLAMDALRRVDGRKETSDIAYLYSMKGRIYFSMNAKKECKESYLKALKIMKNISSNIRFDALEGMGRALMSWGEKEKAVKYLQKALDLAERVGKKDYQEQLIKDINSCREANVRKDAPSDN